MSGHGPRSALDERLGRIDALLETIARLEPELDRLLDLQAHDVGLGSLAPPPPVPAASSADSADPEELARVVAARIVAERRRQGLRQRDLAEATGMARPNVARIESGRRLPAMATLQRIAKALGVGLESLIRPGGPYGAEAQ